MRATTLAVSVPPPAQEQEVPSPAAGRFAVLTGQGRYGLNRVALVRPVQIGGWTPSPPPLPMRDAPPAGTRNEVHAREAPDFGGWRRRVFKGDREPLRAPADRGAGATPGQVRALRRAAGLTQRDLSALIDYSRGAIAEAENPAWQRGQRPGLRAYLYDWLSAYVVHHVMAEAGR